MSADDWTITRATRTLYDGRKQLGLRAEVTASLPRCDFGGRAHFAYVMKLQPIDADGREIRPSVIRIHMRRTMAELDLIVARLERAQPETPPPAEGP